MYVDNSLLFSDSQDLSQTTGDYYSTNVLDLLATTDIGIGSPVLLVITVDEAFTASGAATVKVSLIDEADTTLDGSSVEIVSTDLIGKARLTLGKVFYLPVPAGLITQRYIGVRYDIGTDTTTAGTMSAFLALDAQINP